MNPNRGEASQANFELPPAKPEDEGNRQEKGSEAPAAASEQAGKQAPAPALPVVPDDIPVADQPILPNQTTQSDQTAQAVAQAALPDGDHIPHVWIDKTKTIVAQTREDPYVQKDEVSKIKAEYIQKRFNKQIKVDSPSE